MNLYKLFSKKLLCSSFIVPLFSAVSFCAHAQDPEPMGGGVGGNSGGRSATQLNWGTTGENGRGGNGGTSLRGGLGGAGGDLGVELFGNDTIVRTVTGEDGQAGTEGVRGAANGTGGGGGGAGVVMREGKGSYLLTIGRNSEVRGGNGGDGGAAFSEESPTQGEEREDGGGSGGGGGVGVFIKNSNNLMNHGSIRGGKGGSGGATNGMGGRAGVGGHGGAGVILDNGARMLNLNDISGGQGGNDNAGLDESSLGGMGVLLTGNNTITNAGQIYGGKFGNTGSDGDAVIMAPAIVALGDGNKIVNAGSLHSGGNIAVHISGSDNHFEIRDNSVVVGATIVDGDRNKFVLGGDDDYFFYVPKLGNFNSDAVYRGFNLFEKTGASRRELIGATAAKTPWTISSGTLVVHSDESLGATTEVLTIDGGILELDDNDFDPVEISRPIFLAQNGRGNGISTDDDEAFISSSIAGPGSLSKLGAGTLTLTNDNVYSGGTRVFDGTLKIGDGQAGGSIKGYIQIDEDAELIFDRNDTYSVDNLIDGDGYLTIAGGGTAHFTQDNYAFDGVTEIESGQLSLSGKLGGEIRIGANSLLTGSGTAEYVANKGVLALGSPGNYGDFTITDDYQGLPGSVVHIKAALGDDQSQTDRLVIEGDTYGESSVSIENRGSGGDTINGIEIISIGGASNAEFTLMGDYNLPSGTPAVVAGAHSYVLVKGSDNPQDGNWYLRSSLKDVVCSPDAPENCVICEEDCPIEEDQDMDIYQPGVPLYSGLASIVHRMNRLSGLFERGADRYWRGAGATNIVEGDGPGMLSAAPDPTRQEMVTGAGLVWGRIEAAHTNTNLYGSSTSNRYESDSWKIRAGIDNQFLETEHGRLIGSAWFEYSNLKADLLSFFGNGRIDVDGYALGTSLTWFGDNGLYLDAQAQALWTKSDISSSTLNRNLVNSVKGKGYTLSIEAGQIYAINQEWSLIPNGQITWSQTSLDGFTDPFHAEVSFDRSQALTARGGARIEYGQSWLDSEGFMNRGKLYGSAHLSRELLGRNPGMLVSQEKIKLGHEGRTWGELGLGGIYSFRNDKFSTFGELGFGGYLHDLAENYSLRGNLGLRVNW